MKKICTMILFFTLLLPFAACSNTKTNEELSSSTKQSYERSDTDDEELNNSIGPSAKMETDLESLVVYFSWSGNTEKVAKSIQNQTDSDIFEIVPATPYSNDYDAVVDLAQEEQRTQARPAILGSIENIEQYDVVFVGFPNWWGDMPMILYTFFDTYDLSGKTIAVFCTSGGSGLSNTVNEVKTLEPDANITEGLHIRDHFADDPESEVSNWLNMIGFTK